MQDDKLITAMLASRLGDPRPYSHSGLGMRLNYMVYRSRYDSNDILHATPPQDDPDDTSALSGTTILAIAVGGGVGVAVVVLLVLCVGCYCCCCRTPKYEYATGNEYR